MIIFLKKAAEFLIPLGAEAIMAGITAQSVRNCGRFTKFAAGCTSLVVGYMVGDKAVDFFDKVLDEQKDKWDRYKLGSEGEQ